MNNQNTNIPPLHTSPSLSYDVLVAGGGTAGSAAAIAAARRGHRVLLVEESNALGGVSTTGGVGEWFANLHGLGNIFDETVRELEYFGARFHDPPDRLFNPEYLKFIWQRLAQQAGVEVLFHASVCGTETGHNGTLRQVRIASCASLFDVDARFFIDGTGEGDLAALAGAAFMQGDPSTGHVLHMTLTGWMYDTGVTQTAYLPQDLPPIRSPQDLPGLAAGWKIAPHRVFMNATKIMKHDPTDPFSLSRAEQEARQQLLQITHFLQTHGYPTYALAASGGRIGIREGRRIIGDHVLAQHDVTDRKEPLDVPDGIAVATSQIDFHSLTKSGASGWRQRLQPYAIPLRCLLVRDFSNLMTAGKCISADQVVHSSCRMTPTCCAMGQAAGTMAALAIERHAANLRSVPVECLRQVLSQDGMELDPRRHTSFFTKETRMDDDEPVKSLGKD